MKSEKFHLENSERKCQIWKLFISKSLAFPVKPAALYLTSEIVSDTSQQYFQPPPYLVREKPPISAVPQISFTRSAVRSLLFKYSKLTTILIHITATDSRPLKYRSRYCQIKLCWSGSPRRRPFKNRFCMPAARFHRNLVETTVTIPLPTPDSEGDARKKIIKKDKDKKAPECCISFLNHISFLGRQSVPLPRQKAKQD